MLRLPPTALTALLATALVATIAPAAHAGSWSERDEAKDVVRYRFDSEPEPCGSFVEEDRPKDVSRDITRVRVAHRTDDVRLVAQFRDLSARGSLSDTFVIKTPDRLWELQVDRFGSWGKVEAILFRAPDYDAAQEQAEADEDNECGVVMTSSVGGRCVGIKADIDPRTDRVEAVVPRRCLKDPRWVRVGVTTYGDVEDAEGSWIIEDHWAPRGSTAESGAIPPLSPRVRRDR